MTVTDYGIGDVIEGRFACDPSRVTRAIVGSRVPDAGQGRPGFIGDVIDYEAGKGYGAWGFDHEVTSARPGTPEDTQAATEVRHRVAAATDRMMRRWEGGACGAVLIACSRAVGHEGPHASASGSEWFGPPPARPERSEGRAKASPPVSVVAEEGKP